MCESVHGMNPLQHNSKVLARALRMVGFAPALLGRHKGIGESHAECHAFSRNTRPTLARRGRVVGTHCAKMLFILIDGHAAAQLGAVPIGTPLAQPIHGLVTDLVTAQVNQQAYKRQRIRSLTCTVCTR